MLLQRGDCQCSRQLPAPSQYPAPELFPGTPSTRPGCHSLREEVVPCAPLGSEAQGDVPGTGWALQQDSLPGQHPNPAKTSPAWRRMDLTPLGMLDLLDSHGHTPVPCGTEG